MPVNSVVRVVELPKRCRIRPRRPRCGRQRLSRAELAPHLMPGNQPSHGLRARHQPYLPRQLGAGAAVSPHKRASHAAQAAAAAPPPHPRGRRDGWSCHNSLVAAPSYLQRRQAAFMVLQQAILEVPLEGCSALQNAGSIPTPVLGVQRAASTPLYTLVPIPGVIRQILLVVRHRARTHEGPHKRKNVKNLPLSR